MVETCKNMYLWVKYAITNRGCSFSSETEKYIEYIDSTSTQETVLFYINPPRISVNKLITK